MTSPRAPAGSARSDPQDTTNILPASAGALTWTCAKPLESLSSLVEYVEKEADKSSQWYWRNKRWKSKLSRGVQFSAIVLTAAGGLFPVGGLIAKQLKLIESDPSSLWPSLLVGLAAALLGIDRAFGFSSGWARYVITATAIRKSLEEFRMDWAVLMSRLPKDPKPEQLTPEVLAPLLQRAKEFRLAIEAMVMQETQDWANEFQSNMAQMERDIKAQLESLKIQLQKSRQDEATAAKPGGIQISVINAAKADAGRFEVIVFSKSAAVATDSDPTVRSTASFLDLPPGQYKVVVKAAISSKPVSAATLVTVKPNETSMCEIRLPE